MKVAVIYNRESKKVINLFGRASKEKYGLKSIQRIVNALKKGGHQVQAFEGDKDLIKRLEEFMPQALKGEKPGMAFNLSYGIQGDARYTHVPGILEMVGIPYVGSGPLGHSLALDKVVAKMLFVQNGVSTPPFAVLEDADFPAPDLEYPLIVKPKNEAVSFGIKVVNNEEELREAAGVIFDEFSQDVLVERYIDGREVNVGVLGNGVPEALPVAELVFAQGPKIYTEADKKGTGGVRRVSVSCPADLPPELAETAQKLAVRAFTTLGLYDCARVDLRLDDEGTLYVLEVNSLPSLGEHGSYTQAAAAAGLDFNGLVNRLVDVASARYFGTPDPTRLAGGSDSDLFTFVTQRRDRIEQRIEQRVAQSSRTSDPIGVAAVANDVGKRLTDLGLSLRDESTDAGSTWLYETGPSVRGGTLLVAHVDVPLAHEAPHAPFRRDPEWLYGEGIGTSKAPLVAIEFALRALKPKRLRKLRLGVLLYADEGQDCRYSAKTIRKLSSEAARVLVLRPAGPSGLAVNARRGQRRYRLRIDGASRRLGIASKRPDALQWLFARAQDLLALTNRKQRVSVDVTDVRTQAAPLLAPHRVDATVVVTFPDNAAGDRLEERMREVLNRDNVRWSLDSMADRPATLDAPDRVKLADKVGAVAQAWELPFGVESSVWPSVAGLAPEHTAVLCGMGPAATDLYTSQEAVSRVSVVQRTLLLAGFLASLAE